MKSNLTVTLTEEVNVFLGFQSFVILTFKKKVLWFLRLKFLMFFLHQVPMDDPQDRGDLYLLAPMRLLLSPIAEEPETSDVASHAGEAPGADLNR